MTLKKQLRVALFGLGRAGKFQLESIRSNPGVSLIHVVDTNLGKAKAVANEFRCEYSHSVEEPLSNADIDAVIIATPTGEHFGQIVASLNAGKAVFTEKPLGNGLEEIDTCFQLAREKSLPLFVGFNRRFDPSHSSLAQSVRGGEIGAPQLVRITSRDSPLPSMDYIKTSHGIFHDCIVHDLDMIRFISQEDPIEVYSLGSNFIPEIQAIDDLDNVLVSLRFASGLLASIDVNRFASYGYDQRIEAFGDKGMLQSENRYPQSTVLSSEAGVSRPPIEFSFPSRYREAYQRELETFRKCVVEGIPLPITYEDVRMSFVLSDLAERSYREGRPMRVGG
jgi:myo-inositol 2-dehydrogenase/D-chiro-inositol 1-dehydrogenase